MLSIGIVGLPNVGKSTLFNALTKNNVLAANYPFATIEPNVGIVAVPDERLTKLAEVFKPEKVIPATVSFTDIAGLVKGAAEGQGLGNQFLANIRECQAIAQVVRVFNDPNVVHVDGEINPRSDIETINTELILADMQTLEKRIGKLESEAKRDADAKEVLAAALAAKEILNNGQTLFAARFNVEPLAELGLLTAKPFIYVFNLDESSLQVPALQEELRSLVAPSLAVFLCAKTEAELMELSREEANELLQSLGQASSGIEQLAKTGFAVLGLQTYLTAGPKEVRAWTINKGATAPQAAGVIHTDFEKGFIKAEVVNFQDLIAAGSLVAAKSLGKVRLEGRDYVMKDGDVVEFKFNV